MDGLKIIEAVVSLQQEIKKLRIANDALAVQNTELKMKLQRLEKCLPTDHKTRKAYFIWHLLESARSFPQEKKLLKNA